MSSPHRSGPRVVVVGAGIAGLTAAYDLLRADPSLDVTVFEAAGRVGGKIHTTPFAGLAVDEGADAFLARVPWARELCEELGLEREFVSPANGRAYVYSYGALRPIPSTNLLGVPLDLDELAASGIVSSSAVDIARRDLSRTYDSHPSYDESIGSLVRRRLGDEINERLVDPLLGGIYASDTDLLSLHATTPQFAEAAQRDASLINALRQTRERAVSENAGAPVFYGLLSGTQRLCTALHQRLGDRVRLGAEVVRLSRTANKYMVTVGGESMNADAIVLALPTFRAVELLWQALPAAATLLSNIDYASVVLVTMAVPRDTIDHALDASGFLVPKCEGCFITACSWASTKWAHLARPDMALLRVSAGHVRDARPLDLDDGTVVERMLADLRAMMGPVGDPVELRVTRWGHSFPQYRPGHIGLVNKLDAVLRNDAPRVVVTGAAYGGIGIPATIRHARDTAQRLLSSL